MRQSTLFYKTKRTVPKEIEAISHKLLYRGDFIDQLASGVYTLMPLGFLVHKKIEEIIREEMLKIGAQELYMPVMHPRYLWEKTGRWKTMGDTLFKLKDRHKKEFVLGPTHEEVITKIVKERISSYKDLPLALFQIQIKFRNELRFTGGLLRTREFIMKDLYSFHTDEKDFRKFYDKVIKAYLKIFKRCGLKPIVVEASGEGFTQSVTHEFQVLTPVGEDRIVFCPKCQFAQNKEIARGKEGKKCPVCKRGILEERRGIEIGNIFPLGTKYSKSFDLTFTDKTGKKKLVIMGCYGIGLGRLMAAVVEINHDQKGIIWPKEVAPFLVHLVPVEIKDKKVYQSAEKIYQDLKREQIEVLYDDRKDVLPGEKFVESDLLGIPLRLIISRKNLSKHQAEIKKRGKEKTEFIKLGNIIKYIRAYEKKA